MVKMRELKRDLEYAITRNAAANAGSTITSGRIMAGIETWIAGYLTNAFVGTTVTASTAVCCTAGSNATTPATVSGFPTVAPTDPSAGATAALKATILGLALQGGFLP